MNHFYEKHVFVCENIREGENVRVSCGKSNSKKIKEKLKLKLKELAPEKKIRINTSGCLDRCELGPVVVSYPEGKWFCLKTEEDIDNFLQNYVIKNSIEDVKNLLI